MGDPEVVLEAIFQDGDAFQWACPQLRCDRDFVLKAVSKNGYVLTYASPDLRNDREIVLMAVRCSGWRAEGGKKCMQCNGWALACAGAVRSNNCPGRCKSGWTMPRACSSVSS